MYTKVVYLWFNNLTPSFYSKYQILALLADALIEIHEQVVDDDEEVFMK